MIIMSNLLTKHDLLSANAKYIANEITFKSYKKLFLKALKDDGLLIEYGNDELKNNVEIGMTAVKQNPQSVKFLSSRVARVCLRKLRTNLNIIANNKESILNK